MATLGLMACFSPITGYRTAAGKVTFKQKEGYYDKPVTIACGQCTGCRLERSRQWAVRCMHEAQMHPKNSFVTLTYDDEHLPLDGGLVLGDWQKFAKRLRKRLGPFRFYHCGEYGDQYGRPHYHALIFGLDFGHDRKLYRNSKDNSLYTSELLTGTWGMGMSIIGELTFQSAAYVARYCMKKITGEAAADHYTTTNLATGEVHQVKPEYTTMSRRPGIGKSWLDKYQGDVFPSDEVIVNAKKTRPPRYYDYLYELSEPTGLALVKEGRRSAGRKHRSNNTYERLRIRETIQEKKMQQLKRQL